MKKTLLLTGVLLALTASIALAGGVNLTWSTQCYSLAPVTLKTFACNTNSGFVPMTLSFAIDNEMTDMVGIEFSMYGTSTQTNLPDWWKMNSGECRASAFTYSCDQSTIADETCADWTGGAGYPAFTWSQSGPNTIFVNSGAAISADTPFDMLPNQEFYGGTITLKYLKTMPLATCSGCSYGMKWGLSLVTVAGLGGRRDDLTDPLPGGNQCLDWQTTANTIPCGPAVTPTQNKTWGEVKSLYR